MTGTARALYGFFSSFGLPAFVEYEVPDEATLPYITYQLTQPDWRGSASIYARVWYRSTTLTEITAKVATISAAVGEGITLPTSDGCVLLTKDDTFAQLMPMEGDDTLRVVYLSFTIYAYTT